MTVPERSDLADPATAAFVLGQMPTLLPHVDVARGVVASGEFAGASVTAEGRWSCVTSYDQSTAGRTPCFQSTAGWVHNPMCSRRDAEPLRPLPKTTYRDQAAIDAYEWNLGPHRPEWEITEAARKAAARRAGADS